MGNANVKVSTLVLAATLVLAQSCARAPAAQPDIDPVILSEVNRVRAIDNHAHPVRYVAAGQPDREFDALPVDNMEPQSDPLQLRPDDSGIVAAWKSLWNYPYNDAAPQHLNEWKQHKQEIAQQKG